MHGEYKELGQKMAIVDLDVVDNKLANVRLSGDFFIEPDSALWRITDAIEGLSADASAEDIAQVVEAAVLPTDNLFGLSPRGVAVRCAAPSATPWPGKISISRSFTPRLSTRFSI